MAQKRALVADGLLIQLTSVATKERVVDERGLNFMFSMVKGIAPRDQGDARGPTGRR